MFRKGFRNLIAAPRSWTARSWKTRLGMIFGGLCVLAACAAIRYCWGTSSAKAQNNGQAAWNGLAAPPDGSAAATRSPSPAASGRAPVPDVVATVNGHAITRDELAFECRIHFGTEVLEAMVNKFLILSECHQAGIVITRQDIDDEIKQLAASFGLPVDQWLKLLSQERGIRPDQYANDIIWPSIALRKLAGSRLAVSQKELTEAFESEYGEAIQARLIICASLEKAQKVQALAAANPADFGNLAKQWSDDTPSASIKGMVPPIRRHGAYPEIEQAAFSLNDGDVSLVIRTKTDGQFVILKRERVIAAREITLAQAEPALRKIIADGKLRQASTEIFHELQKKARVQNVLNNPQLRQQLGPEVVALVNGSPIYFRQLDDECIDRHGTDVLQGLIGRRMLELACKQKNVTVSQAEIEAEIARAAAETGKPLPDGKPDVKGFLAVACKQHSVSEDVYCHEVVWPSVALRKLAVGNIDISEDDLKKGFEANYGPRVRCLAIILNKLHQAQEVWKMAKEKPTEEYFGDLAAKYSIERSSRALRGEVPPIRRHGGEPDLENEAFALKPGVLSGIIQLDDKYVILFCLGQTQPIGVKFEEVKKFIIDDIREKKEALAMREYYEDMQKMTTVNNYLEPTASHSASKAAQDGSHPQPGQTIPTSYNSPVQK